MNTRHTRPVNSRDSHLPFGYGALRGEQSHDAAHYVRSGEQLGDMLIALARFIRRCGRWLEAVLLPGNR